MRLQLYRGEERDGIVLENRMDAHEGDDIDPRIIQAMLREIAEGGSAP